MPKSVLSPTPWIHILLTMRYPAPDPYKGKITVLFLGYVNYSNKGVLPATWVKELNCQAEFLLPLGAWRDFLVTPSVCEDSWIAHTRSHNKRERGSQKERESAHSLPITDFFAVVWAGRRSCRKETFQKKTTRLLTNNSRYCLMSCPLLNLYTLPTTLPSRGLPLVQFERFRVTSGKPSFWLSMLKGLW